MSDIEWPGVTRAETLQEDAAATRAVLADAARDGRWDVVREILREHPQWINAPRLGGRSLYAPLHQAAYLGVPPAVVETLLALGAWRTLQNARGERAVDVAERRGHGHLVEILTPVLMRRVPTASC